MKFLASLLVALFPIALGAQNLIQGTVTDSRNNEPLVGAVVICKDLKTTISTNAVGGFTILSPASEEKKYHIITVKYLGYKPQSKAVEILPFDGDHSVNLEFKLEVDPLMIQDITVTAHKVEEDLQDVPVAATVVDRINLKRRTVTDTEEAFATLPNLVTDAYLPGRSTFSLRGLASDFDNAGIENAVGLYIDDVFYSRSYAFNQSLMDIERVEVLRGPQGTLFGKNTIGGVLHVISEEPKMANFTSLELSAGNFNYIQARLKGNIQLSKDKMAIRVTGAYRKRDGWLLEKNPDATEQNGILFFGGRVSMLYKPTPNIKISVKGHFSRDDKADYTTDYKTPDDGMDLIAVDSTLTNFTDRISYRDEENSFFERRMRTAVARVDYKMGSVLTLTAISSYTNVNGSYLRDADATPLPVAAEGQINRFSTIGQEIRVATPRKDRKFFFIGGLFFQREDLSNQDDLYWREGILPVLSRIYGIEPIEIPGYSETISVSSNLLTNSLAVFSSASYEVTDRVRINGGMRFTIETKTLDYFQVCDCEVGLTDYENIGTATEPLIREANDGVFSGNIGVDFKTTDNMLLYINLSRGFKGSGFNTIATPGDDPADAALIFDPEFVNSYEFGFKVKSGNRYTFNGAAFITNFQNKQETVVGNGGVFVRNAESVQGQGVEAEFVGVWNKFLKTEIAVGALNLKYTNFPYINPTTGDEVNLSGKRSIKAPDFTFKFSPEIHTPLGRELKLLARIDMNYVGKVYHDIFNTEGIARRGTGVIHARLGISSKNERFGISIWGKNLNNATYIQHGWSYIYGDVVAVNAPRLLGVEFRANIY